jgi:hypothetical protein
MAMDHNDPAWKLAEAADAAQHGDVDAIDRAFATLKPTPRTLARAYALCLTTPPFSQSEATRLILSTLQFAVAEESGRKLNVLTGWLIALTVALVAFNVFDLWLRLCGC